jgi:hypothetical protein
MDRFVASAPRNDVVGSRLIFQISRSSSPGLTGRSQYPRDRSDRAVKPRHTGSPACAGDDSECAAAAVPFPNTASPSRGTIRPGFAQTFSLEKEGAGNAGCALHPRSRVQKLCEECAHEHTGSAETLRHPPRNGFTAYAVLSSATNSSCHRHCRLDGHSDPVGSHQPPTA